MENEIRRPELKEIKISEVKLLLSEGYTRFERQNKIENGYGYGSIEAHFGLTAGDVSDMFKHPKLKGLKTKVPTFILIDDEEDDEEDDDEIFVSERMKKLMKEEEEKAHEKEGKEMNLVDRIEIVEKTDKEKEIGTTLMNLL